MTSNDNTFSKVFDTLATLLLTGPAQNLLEDNWFAHEIEHVSGFDLEALRGFLAHAQKQRVLRRTLTVLQQYLPNSGQHGPLADLLRETDFEEQERVENVLGYFQGILTAFERHGLPVTIMKTLDHWPDTGSDLDLLANADERDICRILEANFDAIPEPQSWGDRLAHKFNFRLPGLPELVEVHVGCLGQTGEQRPLALGVLSRCRPQTYGTHSLLVPTPEDRVVIATLQRMYRHYYIRLTDIVNIHRLLQKGLIDFERLRAIADSGSIWEGVATLLVIVRQHGIRYGANPVKLPDGVESAAQFSSERTYLGRSFVRVPIVPEGARLFMHQLVGNGRRHNIRSLMRMLLLPPLATAAFVQFRLTGNDKGVW